MGSCSRLILKYFPINFYIVIVSVYKKLLWFTTLWVVLSENYVVYSKHTINCNSLYLQSL